MDTKTKTALVIAVTVVAVVFLLFGGVMATGTIGGFSWMWFPALLVVVLGAVFFSVIFGKKQGK